MSEAIRNLDADNAEAFTGLQKSLDAEGKKKLPSADQVDKEAEKHYKGLSGPRVHHTPPHLKTLIPGRGKLRGVYMIEYPPRSMFCGYYPGAEPFESHTRVWGKTTGRTKQEALDMVLGWMFRQHRRTAGEEPGAAMAAGTAEAEGRDSAHEGEEDDGDKDGAVVGDKRTGKRRSATRVAAKVKAEAKKVPPKAAMKRPAAAAAARTDEGSDDEDDGDAEE